MVGKFSIVIKRKSLQDITFCKVFGDNSKIVVSKNIECHFKVLHVIIIISRNVDYVQLRYRGNKKIKAVTRELAMLGITNDQRWSRGHKARGQAHKKISRPRPRTDPLQAKAKDQGHRHKSSPKKKGHQNFFSGDLKKKVFKKVFQAIST